MPGDRVTLTKEERRILAVLEDRATGGDPKLELSLTAGSLTARLHSRRIVDIAAVLLFVAGVALMLATFARWPIVGIAGAAAQGIALWVMFARWDPRVGVEVRRMTDSLGGRPDSTNRPSRR